MTAISFKSACGLCLAGLDVPIWVIFRSVASNEID